jgi:UDP-N-acetylglucosamine 1-carboxyvinyltransferase
MKYYISGGNKLSGEVVVSGNKNAIFPCVGAALLAQEKVVLENISDISDLKVLICILESLGVEVKKVGSTLIINAEKINSSNLPDHLVTKLRGSIVLSGAILARLKKVSFHHPGGDVIGSRSISTHISGFKELGAIVEKDDLRFSIKLEKISGSKTIFLDEASVTAVENLILTCVLGESEVILKNAPVEPHVLDLCNMINLMGGKIEGIGTSTLKITAVKKLKGVTFRIGIDYIEVGTYLIAAAITGGNIKITGLDKTDLDPVISPLSRFGINIKKENNSIFVEKSELVAVKKITTNIWPGFPTDLMSCVIVLATQSKGMTICYDWMYESRMFFTDKIISMGANIYLADPHRVFVNGPTQLYSRTLETPDIRAGMAMVLAALVAKGRSCINQAELIERGYENIVGKLKSLGADIESHD